jgi:hypothetical protein
MKRCLFWTELPELCCLLWEGGAWGGVPVSSSFSLSTFPVDFFLRIKFFKLIFSKMDNCITSLWSLPKLQITYCGTKVHVGSL